MEAGGGGATVCEDDDAVGRFSRALNQLLRHKIETDQRGGGGSKSRVQFGNALETDTLNIHNINGEPS